jgi:cell division protein FtsZ
LIDQILLDDPEFSNACIIDSDLQVFTETICPEKFLLGSRSLRGLSTRGDMELAANLFQEEVVAVDEYFAGTQIAILAFGLGGGVGSACGVELVKRLKKMGVVTLVFGMTPFEAEGKQHIKQARQAIQELRKHADAVLGVSNERMVRQFEDETDIRRIFHLVNEQMAYSLRSLVDLLTQNCVVPFDIKTLCQMTGDCEGLHDSLETTWLGVGAASGEGKEDLIVEQALGSPLLRDGQVWEMADKLFVSIEGDANLSVSRYQRLMDCLKKSLPKDLPIVIGASANPKLADILRLNVFAICSGEHQVVTTESDWLSQEVQGVEKEKLLSEKEEPQEQISFVEPLVPNVTLVKNKEDVAQKRRVQSYFTEQRELPFDSSVLRGRFEKVDPTLMKGENLDEPTFYRWGIKIRI